MKSDEIEKLITAAERHGKDQEAGDLREALRLAWGFMSSAMREDFMTHASVQDILCDDPERGVEDGQVGPWEPVYNAAFSRYSLVRAWRRSPAETEILRNSAGDVELFHTLFKANRRANALNRSD